MPGVQISIFVIIIAVFIILFSALQHTNSKTTNPADIIPTIQQQAPQSAAQQANQTTVVIQPTLPASDLADWEKASISATIKTAKGDIVLQLDPADAPYTVKTFVDKAKAGFYNGLTFHRVEDWVIQGGDPLGTGTGGGSEPVEFNSKSFTTGALGQASTGDGKTQNDSQFFIVKSDATYLDGKYTNYGTVTSGMDVVNKIAIGDKIENITITQQ